MIMITPNKGGLQMRFQGQVVHLCGKYKDLSKGTYSRIIS